MSTEGWSELKAYLEIEGKNSLEVLTVESENGSRKFSIDAVRLLSFVRTEATSRMVGNTLCGKCRTQKRFTTAFACSADGSCAIAVCDDCLRSLVSSFQEPKNDPPKPPLVLEFQKVNWEVGDIVWVSPNENGLGSGDLKIRRVGKDWVEVGHFGRKFHKTLRTEKDVGPNSLSAYMLSNEERWALWGQYKGSQASTLVEMWDLWVTHLKESLRITSSAIASPHGVLPLTVK